MANQKFSVEEILKEYQSDEATKGKKESPSGKLETQKMLNHAAGRRNVPPSTEASAEAYFPDSIGGGVFLCTQPHQTAYPVFSLPF